MKDFFGIQEMLSVVGNFVSEGVKKCFNSVQGVLAVIGGFLGWCLGGLDGFLYMLIIFVVVDYLTGVAIAIMEKKLSSDIGFKGILKKVLIFVLVGIGNIIDVNVLQNGNAIRTTVIFFYLSNEGISILENCSKVGLPIPQKLKDILAQLNKAEGQ
jgi:toxin secretion/phage lysis holin